jgi:hypothetical protein
MVFVPVPVPTYKSFVPVLIHTFEQVTVPVIALYVDHKKKFVTQIWGIF